MSPPIRPSAEVIEHHAAQHTARCPGGTCLEIACPCGLATELICGACLETVFVILDPTIDVCTHAAELLGVAP